MMPRDGYTSLLESLFAHANIRVSLGVPFEKSMLADYGFYFNAMPIGE
jgi:UDP-galactopyranose mutase